MTTAINLAAKSAICICLPGSDTQSPRVLYEKEPDRPAAPASITKLLTALTALRIAGRTNISPSIRLQMLASDQGGGSGRNLREGDQLSFRDSLANLLLASSNMTANVIARAFGAVLLSGENGWGLDPVARFVREMNAVALNLGMTASRFLNPHGEAAKGQRSTARDLARLVQECLKHPLIVEFWGMDRYVVAIGGPNERRMAVASIFRTSALKAVPGFSTPQLIGVKSGTLYPGVFNLAAVSAASDGSLFISVTMGSPTLEDRCADYLAMVEIANAMAQRPAMASLR